MKACFWALRCRGLRGVVPQKSENLISPCFREYVGGVLFDIFDKPFLIFRHKEKIVLLMNPVNRPAAVRDSCLPPDPFQSRNAHQECSTSRSIPFFNLSSVPEHLKKSLHTLDVCVISCPDKCVMWICSAFSRDS